MSEITDDRYWDCRCERNYIHLKTEMKKCTFCGAREEDMPDSMITEIKLMKDGK